jgi:hypothetical protein
VCGAPPLHNRVTRATICRAGSAVISRRIFPKRNGHQSHCCGIAVVVQYGMIEKKQSCYRRRLAVYTSVRYGRANTVVPRGCVLDNSARTSSATSSWYMAPLSDTTERDVTRLMMVAWSPNCTKPFGIDKSCKGSNNAAVPLASKVARHLPDCCRGVVVGYSVSM